MPDPTRGLKVRDTDSSPLLSGTYYALIIGIDNYEEFDVLDRPVKDANTLKDILCSKYTFTEENVQSLVDPSRDDIIIVLDSLDKKLAKEDSLVIFYAGHGHWEEDRKAGYWLPVNAQKNSRIEWIRNSSIVEYVRGFDCRHVLIISDTCFSGSIFKTRSGLSNASTDIKKLYQAKSRRAMTSGVKEPVPDDSHFIEGLCKTLKNNSKAYLPALDLYSKFYKEVISHSGQKPQFGPINDTGDEGGDFVFMIREEAIQRLNSEQYAPLLKNKFIEERLFDLRRHLDLEIPPGNRKGALLLASWNIRKLGSKQFGDRLQESYGYIAEIISRFDLVAIQEVSGGTRALEIIKDFLGEDYNYLYNSSTAMRAKDYGFAFFYNVKRVRPGRFSSNLMLSRERIRSEDGKRFVYKESKQLARYPYLTSFNIDGIPILCVNTHLFFGKARPDFPERVEEMELIMKYFESMTKLQPHLTENIFLLGDFNLFEKDGLIRKIAVQNGFNIPEALIDTRSNISQNRFYSQIFLKTHSEKFQQTGKGGVIKFYDYVFRKEDWNVYQPQMEEMFKDNNNISRKIKEGNLSEFFPRQWKTHQMSDNYPIWVELEIGG